MILCGLNFKSETDETEVELFDLELIKTLLFDDEQLQDSVRMTVTYLNRIELQ